MEYQPPNQNKAKYQFLLLMERFGLGLTKYYETYQTRETIDYSKYTGYGYDIHSKINKSDENRYIEVKTRLGRKKASHLQQTSLVI